MVGASKPAIPDLPVISGRMICVGQAAVQLPQRIQTPAECSSARAPGGRSGASSVVARARPLFLPHSPSPKPNIDAITARREREIFPGRRAGVVNQTPTAWSPPALIGLTAAH